MEQLPTELVSHLCWFLEKASLRTFRLTCKAFASIAQEHLFHDFEFRLHPNHRRLHQLEQLAANTSIAARLKCVSLESGVQLEYADYRYWQAQVYHDKSSAWERTLATKGDSRNAYTEFHESLQARFTTDLPRKYELYRWHLDQEAASMAERQVRNVLMRTLSLLRQSCQKLRFKLIMAEPQIQLEELEDFDPQAHDSDRVFEPDPRRRVANRRQHCMDHFINFLHAANLSDCEVSDLTAIDMPHQLLTVDGMHGSEVLEETFQGLQKLDIRIGAFPHSDWLSRSGMAEIYFGGRNLAARRLRMLLNHPSSLEDLSLEFPVGTEAEYSFDLFDRTNIDRFPRVWLPHLKTLSLCHFRCSWGDLQAFLLEGKDIMSLVMKDCRLESGSMIDLLEYLSERHLPLVVVSGTWYVDDDSGEWHSHGPDDFTNCFAATSYEGPYASHGMRSKVETFIRDGGKCPLPKWTMEDNMQHVWEVMGDTSWHYLPGLPRH